jgi:hypothetical protein
LLGVPHGLQIDSERLGGSISRPSSSSKTNIAARSPRPTALATKVSARSDLPVPAGPRINVLEPVSMPPPSSASSSGKLLVMTSFLKLVLCSAETSRGNTRTPPVAMVKS